MQWKTVHTLGTITTAPKSTTVYRTQFLDTLTECRPLRQLLHADELERLERFKAEPPAVHYLQTRALLRIVLSKLLGCSILELHLHYSHSKKPFLPPEQVQGLQFNLTHTDNWGGIAITHSGEIGIDFEAHNPARDLPAIARRSFSPAEQAAINALPAEARLQAFFDIWTAKEACLKATGEGITADLQAFTTQLGPPGTPRAVDLPGSWHLQGLPMPPGTSAALAVRIETPTTALPRLYDVPPALLLAECTPR